MTSGREAQYAVGRLSVQPKNLDAGEDSDWRPFGVDGKGPVRSKPKVNKTMPGHVELRIANANLACVESNAIGETSKQPSLLDVGSDPKLARSSAGADGPY